MKKLLLSFGAIAAVAAPVALTVSCSQDPEDVFISIDIPKLIANNWVDDATTQAMQDASSNKNILRLTFNVTNIDGEKDSFTVYLDQSTAEQSADMQKAVDYATEGLNVNQTVQFGLFWSNLMS